MGYYFRIIGGDRDGEVVPVPSDKAITFGRGRQSDVQLHDRKLSRTHSQASIINNRCVVTDLNSTNGTYVSGERIEEQVVHPGDVVTLGTTKLKVVKRADDEGGHDTSVMLANCTRCGKPVTQEALESGDAKGAGGRVYCHECRDALGDELPSKPSFGGTALAVGPGDRFAGYTLGDQMRETLYGAQFKASKKQLGNPVLLTLLRTKSADLAGKLLHACYKVGNLIHPNILLLYETGEDDGQFFYATEFIDGKTLAEMLGEGKSLTHAVAFSIADQVAHAVAAAAEKHHSHGTLAPCNIFVREERQCKVGDFGLAGVAPFAGKGAPFAEELMPYRAPEQLRGRTTSTFEVDLYSLGAAFYHAVVGRPPYTGETSEEIRNAVLDGKYTPIRQAAPDLPDPMARIIERCMASSPSGRYQTPREVLYDFEHALRG